MMVWPRLLEQRACEAVLSHAAVDDAEARHGHKGLAMLVAERAARLQK